MSVSSTDQFHHVFTSNAEPENNSSNFKILLSNPINTSEGDWEVCLKYLSYSLSWATVGKAAKVYMKFFTPQTKLVEIKFPNIHCENLKHVVQYIREQVPLDSDGSPIIQVKVDDIDRFRFTCDKKYFDIGFSENMLLMLGLRGHEHANYLSIQNFNKRQKFRDILQDFLNLQYSNTGLIKQLEKVETLSDFYARVNPNLTNAEELYEKFTKDADFVDIMRETNQDGSVQLGEKEIQLLHLLMSAVKKVLFQFTYLPRIISTTPGEINQVKRMFIYLNILDGLHMNDSTSRILRVVNARGSPFKFTEQEFSNPMYLPVKRGRHDLLQVYIKDDNGDEIPFQSGTVLMILHFRRKSLIW